MRVSVPTSSYCSLVECFFLCWMMSLIHLVQYVCNVVLMEQSTDARTHNPECNYHSYHSLSVVCAHQMHTHMRLYRYIHTLSITAGTPMALYCLIATSAHTILSSESAFQLALPCLYLAGSSYLHRVKIRCCVILVYWRECAEICV